MSVASRTGTPSDDKEPSGLGPLIRAMAEGKEDAFAAFYDLTSHRVYGLVMRILRDASLAEEVTFDVYLQVWREASGFRETRGSPLAWLLTQTRSRAIDRLRAVNRERRFSSTEAVCDADALAAEAQPEEGVVQAERARCVRAALDQLSPEQREVVVLSYFEGLSHGEIAERLMLPLGTVKTRIRSGMGRLHACLAPWFDEDER